MTCIDFSVGLESILSKRKGKGDVYRPHHFCSNHGRISNQTFSHLRSALPWPGQSPQVFLPGSVSSHVLCSTDLPRKPARYRSLPISLAAQAVSHGHRSLPRPEHSGRGQQKAGLAHLRRHLPALDQPGSQPVCRRRLWQGTERRHTLRSGFKHYRSMSFTFPLGALSQDKSSRKAPHPHGPARQHPCICPHFRGQAARRQYPGPAVARARRFLRYGSRLYGLHPPAPDSQRLRLFCDPSQKKLQTQAQVLTPRGQNHRPKMRPNRGPDHLLSFQTISGALAPHSFCGSGHPKAPGVFGHQFSTPRSDHCIALQGPLAHIAFLQVDQAAPTDQGVLLHQPKRRENSNLERNLDLFAGGHTQKRTRSQP